MISEKLKYHVYCGGVCFCQVGLVRKQDSRYGKHKQKV